MREGFFSDRTYKESIQEELSELLSRFDNLDEAWDDRNVRKLIAKGKADWIAGISDWIIFLTLTFRDETAYDVAIKKYKWLVKELNKDLIGNHYSRKVGHSYFSYVLGIEYQRRDVVHFHVLIDKPVYFDLVHEFWNDIAGFAKPEITKSFDHAVSYVTKYVSKGGDVMPPYTAEIDYQPEILPDWWKTKSQEIRE